MLLGTQQEKCCLPSNAIQTTHSIGKKSSEGLGDSTNSKAMELLEHFPDFCSNRAALAVYTDVLCTDYVVVL